MSMQWETSKTDHVPAISLWAMYRAHPATDRSSDFFVLSGLFFTKVLKNGPLNAGQIPGSF
jgi:hypothetical protein